MVEKQIKIQVYTSQTKITISKDDDEDRYILNLNDYGNGYVEYYLTRENIEELSNALNWMKLKT